jgi:acetyl esterase/lipase
MFAWLGRTWLGLLMLCVAVPTTIAAALILLPPLLGSGGREIRIVLTEWSLLLFLPALLSLLLAGAAYWAGWRRLPGLVAALAVIALGLAVLPPIRGTVAADDAGVRLRPMEYFAGTVRESVRLPDETVTYSEPEPKLTLDVWRPPGPRSQSAPAVVLVHSGDWAPGSPLERSGQAPRWNAWLADQGFVVFDIDHRQAEDVRRAVDWIRRNAGRYGVDQERVVLMGAGTGGRLALLAAYDQPDSGSVAAVVTLYAPTELTSWFTEHRPWWYAPRLWDSRREQALAFTGGTPDGVPDAYRAAEPIRQVHAGLPPTLLVQGGSDLVASPSGVRRLAGALDQTGNSARYAEIEYADHGFDLNWGGFASQIARAEIADFLRPVRDQQGAAD